MALTYDDWITELEDAIVNHIDIYMPTDVQILIDTELPRPFTKPVITLSQIDGERRNTGGMNTVGSGEQGYWQNLSYLVTVNTDDGDYQLNGKTGRNKVATELETIAFGQQKHRLAIEVDGALKANINPIGPALSGGPTDDRKIYQYMFTLEIELIIPFTSLVL